MIQAISENIKITKVADAVTAATGDVNGSSLDMAGYDGVIFFTSYGTAAADNEIHAEVSSDNNVGDAWAAVASSEVSSAGSDEDQWLDVLRPVERYIRCVAERGTSSALGDIWALQYGGRVLAADNTTAGTIHGETSIEAAEGTQ